MLNVIQLEKHGMPIRLAEAADDYEIVRRTLAFITDHWRRQPTVEEMAEHVGLSPGHLHHLFRRWAGLTPKDFLQAITLDAARALLHLDADANALDAQAYDIVTIASVADDVAMLKLSLEGGCKATNITSPYYGTALIAAAHLGHDEVVRMLIAARAPLDHVNNLGWTALIESIVLGNGGERHTATLKALVEAGANVNIADRSGATPLTLAKGRGYAAMVTILENAGAR